jgi:hypothetical protein
MADGLTDERSTQGARHHGGVDLDRRPFDEVCGFLVGQNERINLRTHLTVGRACFTEIIRSPLRGQINRGLENLFDLFKVQRRHRFTFNYVKRQTIRNTGIGFCQFGVARASCA